MADALAGIKKNPIKQSRPTKSPTNKPNAVQKSGQNKGKACPEGNANPSKHASSTSGENAAAAQGRAIHEKSQPPRELDPNDKNWIKDKRLKDNSRPDWRNDGNDEGRRFVVEEKPMSPSNLRKAGSQGRKYAKQLKNQTGYDYEVWGRLYPGSYKGK
jgi:hypothetical protein